MQQTQKYSWFHLALIVLAFLISGAYLALSVMLQYTTLTGAAADASSKFRDITAGTYDAIVTTELYNRGAFTGYPDGSFGLYTTLNRAELAKILVTAANMPVVHSSADSPFKDIDPADWFAGHVSTVKAHGVVQGYPDATYRPGNIVTRAEYMKMLSEAFNLHKNVGYTFRDVNGAAWYAQYVGWYEQQGIFFPPMLQPERPITRLEAARAMYAAIKLGGIPPSYTAPQSPNVQTQSSTVATPVPRQQQGTNYSNVPKDTITQEFTFDQNFSDDTSFFDETDVFTDPYQQQSSSADPLNEFNLDDLFNESFGNDDPFSDSLFSSSASSQSEFSLNEFNLEDMFNDETDPFSDPFVNQQASSSGTEFTPDDFSFDDFDFDMDFDFAF